MSEVTGTFSGTGQSNPVSGRNVQIMMDFAGTASVDIEVRGRDGGWIKKTTGITADHHSTISDPTRVTVRLNCTAHTNNVVYSLVSTNSTS